MLQPILKVDLTTRQVDNFFPPNEWISEYLGGASLAARILFDFLSKDLDPLEARSPLLFLNGPLTGSAGPAVGRFAVCGKSPATGLWAESNCGGFWGPELRKAGFDGVWVTGRAVSPVWLWIRDGKAEIRQADHLWGQDTYQVQASIQGELSEKNVRVASIGIGGESQIPFSLILCDHGRVAGRTGMGAVMGSKNLKAIAVKGSGEIPLIDWEAYRPIRSRANRELRAHNQSQVMRALGTAGGADYFDYIGTMPKKYFQSGVFEGAEKVSGSSFAETILSGVSACHACVIACGRVVTLADGKRRKGPEYETIAGFGPNLLIDEAAEITHLGELCDRYGLDSISMSNTIGLAYKMYEEGWITPADTGGLALVWGDAEAAKTCVEWTARRSSFGRLLAMGAKGLAAHFGQVEAAVQVNGLELAYHDPRGSSGMALVYATSPRGGCHNQSDYFLVDMGHCEDDLGIRFFERQEGSVKAANVARHQDWRTVGNALVLCQLANVPPKDVLALVNAASGLRWSLEDLLRSGERGWNLKRVINVRLGLNRKSDRLPPALLRPLPDGGAAGYVPDLDGMLQAYYQARGWDQATGMPEKRKLAELGLAWVLAR